MRPARSIATRTMPFDIVTPRFVAFTSTACGSGPISAASTTLTPSAGMSRASMSASPTFTTPQRAVDAVLRTSTGRFMPRVSASFANPDSSASRSACATSLIAAWSSRASLYTASIDEPGRMSWNWLRSSVFHARSIRARNAARSFALIAGSEHASASTSRSALSARRF